MKHLTNAQIDEINMLLKDHGEALTAFYDEGMAYGARNAVIGMFIGATIYLSIEVIRYVKKHEKSKEEES